MNLQDRIADFALVLQNCLKKIKSDDRKGPLIYGKLYGQYDDNSDLELSGASLVDFTKLDLANEGVR